MKKMKQTYTPQLLCQSDEAKRMLEFVQNIFDLEYEECPNYDKLRFMLLKIMLEVNQTPNNEYDWNVHYIQRLKSE